MILFIMMSINEFIVVGFCSHLVAARRRGLREEAMPGLCISTRKCNLPFRLYIPAIDTPSNIADPTT